MILQQWTFNEGPRTRGDVRVGLVLAKGLPIVEREGLWKKDNREKQIRSGQEKGKKFVRETQPIKPGEIQRKRTKNAIAYCVKHTGGGNS